MTDEGAVCTYYLQFLRRIGILSLIRPRYRSATFPQGKALLGRCAPSHKLQFIALTAKSTLYEMKNVLYNMSYLKREVCP